MAEQRRITLYDVAKFAEVSRTAAGHVLLGSGQNGIRVSPKTAARVRKAALKLGYTPNRAAQQLRGKPSQLVSVIMALDAPAVELDRLLQLEHQGCRRGFHMTVSAVPSKEPLKEIQRIVDQLAGRGVDGFIFLTPDEAIYQNGFPNLHGVPAAFNGVGPRFGRQVAVGMDLAAGGRLSAEHLLQRGRRRIGTAYLGPNVFSQRRLEGLFSPIAEAGVEMIPTIFVQFPPGLQQLPEPQAERLVDEVVIQSRADALIVENDFWAAGLLKVMHRRGIRVPEDVALIGYNNLDLSRFTDPALTTVEEHNDHIAARLVDLLVRRMGGETFVHQELVEPELVVRQSA